MKSGVPQGSILGPSLFLFYINDLAESLDSTVRLFADDTVLYLVVGSESDAITLQNDLDKLAAWEHKWQMEFHPDKCKCIRVTRNTMHIINTSYTLNGHTLEVVDSAKYLGITITKDLRWSKHINNITKTAKGKLAFLQRNIRLQSPKIKTIANKTFIRPSLEYTSTAWDPYIKEDINNIEAIQRRAARWTLNKHRRGPDSESVTAMLHRLKWTPLIERREQARACMLYKIIMGL